MKPFRFLSRLRDWMGWETLTETKRRHAEIMSAIKNYTDAVNAKFDEINTGLGALTDSVADIGADVSYLKDTITKLQNTQGGITPEDQALLDAAQNAVTALAGKTSALATAAKTLADATDSNPPPA